MAGLRCFRAFSSLYAPLEVGYMPEEVDLNPYVNFTKYLPNPVFATLMAVRNRVVMLFSGNRYGKTRAISRACVFRGMGLSKHADHNIKPEDECRTIRFAAKMLPQDKDNEVKNTIYPMIKLQMPHNYIVKDITARVPVITYKPRLGGKNAMFEFVSYGQEDDTHAGHERRLIVLDEVPPYEVYEESVPRVITVNGQIIGGTTPVEAGWMHTELYEQAKVFYRTDAVRAFIKKQYGQEYKPVERTDSLKDIAIIQAATDDNPIWALFMQERFAEIAKGILKKEDFPFETVSEYLDAGYLYSDPDTMAMRRYGIFRQITGAVHKEFHWQTHVVPGGKYFPTGIPADWKFARMIDYHQSVPWAMMWIALSPDDEAFVWEEMNPNPHDKTTYDITSEMMTRSKDYRYRINLIDKLANETQPNCRTANRTALDEINAILRERGRLSYDGDTAFEAWDDRTTTGEDRVRQRLINSLKCGYPFNNRQRNEDGVKVRIPTLWILDNCRETALSLKNWKMNTWTERDSIITKDPKDSKENKWSHFNMCLEAIFKDSRFRANTGARMNFRDKFMSEPYRYFQGRG